MNTDAEPSPVYRRATRLERIADIARGTPAFLLAAAAGLLAAAAGVLVMGAIVTAASFLPHLLTSSADIVTATQGGAAPGDHGGLAGTLGGAAQMIAFFGGLAIGLPAAAKTMRLVIRHFPLPGPRPDRLVQQ